MNKPCPDIPCPTPEREPVVLASEHSTVECRHPCECDEPAAPCAPDIAPLEALLPNCTRAEDGYLVRYVQHPDEVHRVVVLEQRGWVQKLGCRDGSCSGPGLKKPYRPTQGAVDYGFHTRDRKIYIYKPPTAVEGIIFFMSPELKADLDHDGYGYIYITNHNEQNYFQTAAVHQDNRHVTSGVASYRGSGQHMTNDLDVVAKEDSIGTFPHIPSDQVVGQPSGVMPCEVAAQAAEDSGETTGVTPVSVDVLANDMPGDYPIVPATLALLNPSTQAQESTVTVPGEGIWLIVAEQVQFTPLAGFEGTAVIQYVVQDEEGNLSNDATVSVTVTDNPTP